MAEWYDQPEPPPPPPKAQDPGFWEALVGSVHADPVLKKLHEWGLITLPHPVQGPPGQPGMKGEPTLEMVRAMQPKARRRNLLDSYNTDEGDIMPPPKKKEP
jgi:hypothetical protein